MALPPRWLFAWLAFTSKRFALEAGSYDMLTGWWHRELAPTNVNQPSLSLLTSSFHLQNIMHLKLVQANPFMTIVSGITAQVNHTQIQRQGPKFVSCGLETCVQFAALPARLNKSAHLLASTKAALNLTCFGDVLAWECMQTCCWNFDPTHVTQPFCCPPASPHLLIQRFGELQEAVLALLTVNGTEELENICQQQSFAHSCEKGGCMQYNILSSLACEKGSLSFQLSTPYYFAVDWATQGFRIPPFSRRSPPFSRRSPPPHFNVSLELTHVLHLLDFCCVPACAQGGNASAWVFTLCTSFSPYSQCPTASLHHFCGRWAQLQDYRSSPQRGNALAWVFTLCSSFSPHSQCPTANLHHFCARWAQLQEYQSSAGLYSRLETSLRRDSGRMVGPLRADVLSGGLHTSRSPFTVLCSLACTADWVSGLAPRRPAYILWLGPWRSLPFQTPRQTHSDFITLAGTCTPHRYCMVTRWLPTTSLGSVTTPCIALILEWGYVWLDSILDRQRANRAMHGSTPSPLFVGTTAMLFPFAACANFNLAHCLCNRVLCVTSLQTFVAVSTGGFQGTIGSLATTCFRPPPPTADMSRAMRILIIWITCLVLISTFHLNIPVLLCFRTTIFAVHFTIHCLRALIWSPLTSCLHRVGNYFGFELLRASVWRIS